MAAVALSGRRFDVLGVRAAAGRLLGPADDVPGAPNVAVLSYGLWQQEFSGTPTAVISRSIAARLFADANATGRYVQVGTGEQPVFVVGVAADATLGDPRTPLEPAVYLNFWDQPPSSRNTLSSSSAPTFLRRRSPRPYDRNWLAADDFIRWRFSRSPPTWTPRCSRSGSCRLHRRCLPESACCSPRSACSDLRA
jgi:hypothetical protein